MLIGIDGNEANVAKRVGSNQYAFELLQAVHRQKDIGYRIIVYLRDEPLKDMPKENDYWHYRVIKPRKFWTQFRLPLDLYLHQPRPDIFFTAGHYSPRWSPIPRVISIMDLGFLKFPDQFTKKDLYQLTAWTERSAKAAKHIFAISESTKNAIINEYGILSDKITVTYPGFDRDKFRVQSAKCKVDAVKEKYGISGKYILFLSTLKPNKNIEGLIKAFELLITNHQSQLTLVVAGKKGWLYQSIFDKVKQLGLEKKVIFTDFVPEDDVPVLTQSAEVFVLPSFWEGFGIPVVEAMACGVPVVVSNAGSLPEIVGDAGIIVDPNNTEEIAQGINKAIENKTELVKKGFEQIQKFSWDKCAEKTLAVLEKL